MRSGVKRPRPASRGKSAGDMASARRRHVARQRLYDQIKALRELPPGQTGVVRVHGVSYRCVALDEWDHDNVEYVYVHKGRVGVAYEAHFKLHPVGYGSIRNPKILARVLERLP